MKEVVELLPVIWWPLIYGGIAMYVFRVTHSPNSFKDTQLRWLISYGIGYVLWNVEQSYIMPAMPNCPHLILNAMVLGVVVVAAYLAGRIFNSNIFERGLVKLHISANPASDFWDAMQDMSYGTYIYATIPADHMAVAGSISFLETGIAQPQIAISNYRTYDLSPEVDRYDRNDHWMGKVMDDYREDSHRLFIIDVKKCGHIELRYPNGSNKRV